MHLIKFNLQHGRRTIPFIKLDFSGKIFVKTFLVIFFASYTCIANASLVNLTGSAPEQSSIIIPVNKPADASKGLITLLVNDADMADEGELVINGHTAIPLFGAAGNTANDTKSTNITISTPASYWRDGNNTLLFRHTRTGGYVIYDVTVRFEVSPPAPTEPPVSDGLFPVDLTGSAPEQSSIIIPVNKPADASKALINLLVNDADMADEGELVINGHTAIPLFGAAGNTANDTKSTNITISTPASYWRDGNNTLLFRHTRTGGYVIYDVTVQFEVSPPAPTEPPVIDGLFPVDLTGSAPEQSSVIIPVNKPADASKGLITLLVNDADMADEGELVINGHTAIPLFGAAGNTANDTKSTNITISTPAYYWRDGNNTLLFRHTRTGGYVIYDVTVQFEVSPPASHRTTTPYRTTGKRWLISGRSYRFGTRTELDHNTSQQTCRCEQGINHSACQRCRHG